MKAPLINFSLSAFLATNYAYTKAETSPTLIISLIQSQNDCELINFFSFKDDHMLWQVIKYFVDITHCIKCYIK